MIEIRIKYKIKGVSKNLKIEEEVENFITKDLDEKVESVKSKILDRQSGDIKAELEEAKAKLEKDFQVNFQKEGYIEAKANQYRKCQTIGP